MQMTRDLPDKGWCWTLWNPAIARIFYVDCTGGSDHADCGWERAPCGTIQHTINQAESGDVVEVLAGICTGEGNADLHYGGRGIEVRGQQTSGTPTSIIDCKGNSRAITFNQGEGSDSVLRSMVIRHCSADWGGAIMCASSAPTIAECRFEGNQASFAGGALFWSGRAGPMVIACEFVGNRAAGYGADTASETYGIQIAAGAAVEAGLRWYTSGELIAPPVRVEIVDYYGNMVATDSDSVVKAQVRHAPGAIGAEAEVEGLLEGSDSVVAARGVALFPALVLRAAPGTFLGLGFSLRGGELESESLSVQVRRCEPGEQAQADGLGCERCPPGWFSPAPPVPCVPCPRGTVCPGGDELHVRPGFMLDSVTPLDVRTCPDPQACLGGSLAPGGASAGTCAAGRDGELCRECSAGRPCFGGCVEGVCWGIWAILALTLAAPLAAGGILFFGPAARAEDESLLRAVVAAARRKKLRRRRLEGGEEVEGETELLYPGDAARRNDLDVTGWGISDSEDEASAGGGSDASGGRSRRGRRREGTGERRGSQRRGRGGRGGRDGRGGEDGLARSLPRTPRPAAPPPSAGGLVETVRGAALRLLRAGRRWARVASEDGRGRGLLYKEGGEGQEGEAGGEELDGALVHEEQQAAVLHPHPAPALPRHTRQPPTLPTFPARPAPGGTGPAGSEGAAAVVRRHGDGAVEHDPPVGGTSAVPLHLGPPPSALSPPAQPQSNTAPWYAPGRAGGGGQEGGGAGRKGMGAVNLRAMLEVARLPARAPVAPEAGPEGHHAPM